MRWKNETQKRSLTWEFIQAIEKVSEAYDEGYINWNMYQTATENIDRHINKYIFFTANGKKIRIF